MHVYTPSGGTAIVQCHGSGDPGDLTRAERWPTKPRQDELCNCGRYGALILILVVPPVDREELVTQAALRDAPAIWCWTPGGSGLESACWASYSGTSLLLVELWNVSSALPTVYLYGIRHPQVATLVRLRPHFSPAPIGATWRDPLGIYGLPSGTYLNGVPTLKL